LLLIAFPPLYILRTLIVAFVRASPPFTYMKWK
jgi:hypothetical protein